METIKNNIIAIAFVAVLAALVSTCIILAKIFMYA